MSERIGILTGGGDCPGLNAVIRAVVKAAAKRGWETIGFLDGFEGLLDLRHRSLNYHEMDGLLLLGGTILGTTNKGRFAAKTGHGDVTKIPVETLDRLRTTAESHNRVMVLEVMGRYTGWIATHAGIGGGGDIILIPEIPFRYESICAKIAEREQQAKKFTLVVVAEGACEKGRGFFGTTDEKNRE